MDDADSIFHDLVTTSWDAHHASFYDDRADELVVGALISSLVGGGYALIGLHSDGTDHHLRFQQAGTRLVLRLTRQAGRRASLLIGYGERTPDLGRIWPTFEPEAKSLHSPAWEPGILSFDADLSAGYLYTQISLVLDLNRYLGDDFQVDLKLFSSHLAGLNDCLKRYLRGRLGRTQEPGDAPPPRECEHEMAMGKLIHLMGEAGYPVIGLSTDETAWRVRFRAQTDPVLHAVLVGVALPILSVQAEVKNYLPHPGQLLELAEQLKTLPEGVHYRMNSIYAREDVRSTDEVLAAVGRMRDKLKPFKKSFSPFSQKIVRKKA